MGGLISVPLFILLVFVCIGAIVILINLLFKHLGAFDSIIRYELYIILGGFIACLLAMILNMIHRIGVL